MTMDVVANALLFWKIVEASLVELFGWESSAARERVLQLRGRMTKSAIVQDVTYHSQPLHVAGDIAYFLGPIGDTMLKAYDEVVQRVTAQFVADAEVPEAKPRKPRVHASTGSRAVAALSR